MLQLVTTKSDKYSVAEQAQMAIEGGCAWIEVDPASVDDGSSLREVLEMLISLCQESETILTVRHDVTICKDMKIHGVHLTAGDMSTTEARAELGPHAIIGVDVTSADEILPLAALDIDYASLGTFGPDFGFDKYTEIISAARQQGAKTPVVARGHITLDDIVMLKGAGVNGIAIGAPIISAPDPVVATRAYLQLLQQ